jgi:hypothetical protein
MALCPLILDVDKLDPSISPSRFACVVVVLATVASLCRVLLFLSKCFELNARLMNHNPASIWNSSFNMNHFIFITRPLEINLTGFVPVSKNIPSSVQKVNFKRFKHFYTPSSWVVSQYANNHNEDTFSPSSEKKNRACFASLPLPHLLPVVYGTITAKTKDFANELNENQLLRFCSFESNNEADDGCSYNENNSSILIIVRFPC